MVLAFSSNFTELGEPELQPSKWAHRPIYVQAGDHMKVLGIKQKQPVPLGVPFEVDSLLFRGKVLLRFRNAKSDDEVKSDEYFDGRKRLMQTVIQGKFKRPLRMDEVYVGSLFARPLAGAPPQSMTEIMSAVIRRIAPGLVLDLSSDSPKVIALLAGTAQTMSIDMKGEEPDITLRDIPENVSHALGTSLTTKSRRKKVLSKPKKAMQYTFDTSYVYTFHTYDDAMDYGLGTMHIPMYGEYDLKPKIGRQPLSLTAVTQSGEILYDLRVWHEDSFVK